jgi:hypothetical protein
MRWNKYEKPTILDEIKIIQDQLHEDGFHLDSYPKDTKHFIKRHAKNGHFILKEENGQVVVYRPSTDNN